MFTSFKSLKRKTSSNGINRQEFIAHLADEFYISTDLEAQQQVTANLSNFAYDPINWNYLKKADVPKLFLELVETPSETLQLHGTAGLCNICLDRDFYQIIIKPEIITRIHQLSLKSSNAEILLNCLSLFYQLLSNEASCKPNVLTAEILKRIQDLNSTFKSDKRLYNISSLLLEDFGKRYEFVEEPSTAFS